MLDNLQEDPWGFIPPLHIVRPPSSWPLPLAGFLTLAPGNQKHPQLSIASTLVQPLHSFWSYFSSILDTYRPGGNHCHLYLALAMKVMQLRRSFSTEHCVLPSDVWCQLWYQCHLSNILKWEWTFSSKSSVVESLRSRKTAECFPCGSNQWMGIWTPLVCTLTPLLWVGGHFLAQSTCWLSC